METEHDTAEGFEEEEDFPEGEDQGQQGTPSFPAVEQALKDAEAQTGKAPAAAAPAAKPGAAAAQTGKAPAAAPGQRSGPVVAEAVRLRTERQRLETDRQSFQKEREGLAPLLKVSELIGKGDRVGALRALAGGDEAFYALISEAATAAAEVKEKNPAAAATALPKAVQSELADLRAKAQKADALESRLAALEKERAEQLRAQQQQGHAAQAEQVWNAGWAQVQAKAAELPHVVRPDDEEAQAQAMDLVEDEYLRLVRTERSTTGRPIALERAQVLVGEAAANVNARLAKLLPQSARPGKVGSGPAATAGRPRATATRPVTSATGQGTPRPRTLPPRGADAPPARVDKSNLSDKERVDQAAEALAAAFPELR